MVFLDTNVILYALHNGKDGIEGKAVISRGLLAAKPAISIQVINETFSVLRRKYLQSREKASESARFLIAKARIFDLKLGDLELALELGEIYQLNHYDSLIVANALNNSAEILYSEDMHHGLTLESRLKIINPFLK